MGFTVPHSGGVVPAGAVSDGFYLTENNTIGLSSTVKGPGAGPERWFACEEAFDGGADANSAPSWRIYWDGEGVLSGTSGCVSVPLAVHVEGGDCRLPSSS